MQCAPSPKHELRLPKSIRKSFITSCGKSGANKNGSLTYIYRNTHTNRHCITCTQCTSFKCNQCHWILGARHEQFQVIYDLLEFRISRTQCSQHTEKFCQYEFCYANVCPNHEDICSAHTPTHTHTWERRVRISVFYILDSIGTPWFVFHSRGRERECEHDR